MPCFCFTMLLYINSRHHACRRGDNMKKRNILILVAVLVIALVAVLFLRPKNNSEAVDYAEVTYDVDYSDMNALFQESSYDYHLFELPEEPDGSVAFVGDPMMYYENGTYYIYYLKEGGNSFHHSVFLTTTEDFITYKHYNDPIIEAEAGKQDDWIGTGSVVKVNDKYYFFYTGHVGGGREFNETIMLAEGTSPLEFVKKEGWEITPPAEIKQKTDFRDPQAYYNAEKDVIEMTVTASVSGVAKIHKFTVSSDLSEVTYDGEILSDPLEAFWNLECSDTFKVGDRWYITYSGQDDTLWYASGDSQFGPYDEPRRIDDKLFYAAKHIEDGENSYMIGWLRRSQTPASLDEVSAWAGNLQVQKINQNPDGSLYFSPVDNVKALFKDRRPLISKGSSVSLKAENEKVIAPVTNAYERFMITGTFTYTGKGDFGLSFDYDGTPETSKLITISPSIGYMSFDLNNGDTNITGAAADLKEGETYSFTYMQEGSCGVFYIDTIGSLTVRVYGVSGRQVSLFADGCTLEVNDLAVYTAGFAD